MGNGKGKTTEANRIYRDTLTSKHHSQMDILFKNQFQKVTDSTPSAFKAVSFLQARLRIWALACVFAPVFVTLQPITSFAQPVPAAIAVNTFAYARGSSDDGTLNRKFSVEPLFLSMSEVSQRGFGVLDLDMLMRYATQWTYRFAYPKHEDPGLDHAYITVNKGIFLLHDGQGGAFDFGLGLDLDWRRAESVPREGHPATESRNLLGLGAVARFKLDVGRNFLFSPAITYDAYFLPDAHDQYIEGHGWRFSGDIWLSAWSGRSTVTLQPFWHWRRLDTERGSSSVFDATTSTFGCKFGFGTRP